MNERIQTLITQAQPDPVAYRVEHFKGDVGYWDKNEPVWKSGLYQKDKEHFNCKPLYTQEDLEKLIQLVAQECTSLMLKEKEYYAQTLSYESREYYERMAAKEDAFNEAASLIEYHFKNKP